MADRRHSTQQPGPTTWEFTNRTKQQDEAAVNVAEIRHWRRHRTRESFVACWACKPLEYCIAFE